MIETPSRPRSVAVSLTALPSVSFIPIHSIHPSALIHSGRLNADVVSWSRQCPYHRGCRKHERKDDRKPRPVATTVSPDVANKRVSHRLRQPMPKSDAIDFERIDDELRRQQTQEHQSADSCHDVDLSETLTPSNENEISDGWRNSASLRVESGIHGKLGTEAGNLSFHRLVRPADLYLD